MKIVKRAAFAAVLALSALAASAQTFPVRPVRFIVPFVPGGGTDTFARILGTRLSETWGQQMIVDNRPGAQGNIGTVLGAKAPPDGYTLTLAFVGTLAINPHLYHPAGFDPLKDFVAVSRGTTEPWVFSVNSAFQAKDVKELIAMAKRTPGKLTFGSGSSGSQLAGELFKLAAGVNLLHVPYKGTAPAVADVLGGNINMATSVPTSVVGHVKSGRLRALLVTGAQRNEMMPGVPHAVEAGLPELNVTSWYGVVMPSAVSRPLLQKLNADVAGALGTKEVRERLAAAGLNAAPSTSAEFQAEIRRDHAVWGKVVKAVNLKPE